MQTKLQSIKSVLGGCFLGGVGDIREAFRAIELTTPLLAAPLGAPCEGLRALEKICYNLLDKQVSKRRGRFPGLLVVSFPTDSSCFAIGKRNIWSVRTDRILRRCAFSSDCNALNVHVLSLSEPQVPGELDKVDETPPLSEDAKVALVSEAYIIFHAYIELERRIRPENLQARIQVLLREPRLDQYLKLSIPWKSVSFSTSS